MSLRPIPSSAKFSPEIKEVRPTAAPEVKDAPPPENEEKTDPPPQLDEALKQLRDKLKTVAGEKSDAMILDSLFYAQLREVYLSPNPLMKAEALERVMALNEFDNEEELLMDAVCSCFRLLLREGHWRQADSEDFFDRLYHLHTLRYGSRNITPVLMVIDAGTFGQFLSPKSQKIMGDEEQFNLIAKCLARVKGDISADKTKKEIAEICDKALMKKIGKPGEWSGSTVRLKYQYMRNLRKLHLNLVETAKKEHSKRSKLKYFEKRDNLGGVVCGVDFAGVAGLKKLTLQSIVVSSDPKDVYFFAQELEEETPDAKPDPNIRLFHRPLYRFELIPGTQLVRLQKAPEDIKDGILRMIGEIQAELNVTVDCAVKTAIWHQKELVLVDTLGEMGRLLRVRTPCREAMTFVKKLPQPKEGWLSDPREFQSFKKKLGEVLIGGCVLATQDLISDLHQEELFDPLESSKVFAETAVMKIIKKATAQVVNAHTHPGKWLVKWILACCYDGDPKELEKRDAAST